MRDGGDDQDPVHAIQPNIYKVTMMVTMVVVLGKGQKGRTPVHKHKNKEKQKG